MIRPFKPYTNITSSSDITSFSMSESIDGWADGKEKLKDIGFSSAPELAEGSPFLLEPLVGPNQKFFITATPPRAAPTMSTVIRGSGHDPKRYAYVVKSEQIDIEGPENKPSRPQEAPDVSFSLLAAYSKIELPFNNLEE